MLRSVLSIGAIVLGSGAANAAPDLSFPLGVGSELFWTSTYDGGSDRYFERLLIDQEDVQIFKAVTGSSESEPSDYFAIFSGIYFTACDTVLPTSEERIALAGLWPLETGGTVEIKSGDGAKFEVGEPSEFFLMGKHRPAHSIMGTYYGDEESTETLIVLDDTKLTVGIHWDETSRDTVTLVTKPDAVASTFADIDLIGTCSDLLNTETDQN